MDGTVCVAACAVAPAGAVSNKRRRAMHDAKHACWNVMQDPTPHLIRHGLEESPQLLVFLVQLLKLRHDGGVGSASLAHHDVLPF